MFRISIMSNFRRLFGAIKMSLARDGSLTDTPSRDVCGVRLPMVPVLCNRLEAV